MDRIKELSDRVAHTVLVALCNDPEILKRASEFADLLERRSPSEDEIESDRSAAATRRKRKAPVAETVECQRCRQMYYDEDQHPEACQYHDGYLEPDYDGGFWDEHDEETYGPIDTEQNREDFPAGFFWDCCGQKGDESPGCQTDYHLPVDRGSSKRSRFEVDPPQDIDSVDGEEDGGDSNGDDEDDDDGDGEAGDVDVDGDVYQSPGDDEELSRPSEDYEEADDARGDEGQGESDLEDAGEYQLHDVIDEVEVTGYYEVAEVIEAEDEDDGGAALVDDLSQEGGEGVLHGGYEPVADEDDDEDQPGLAEEPNGGDSPEPPEMRGESEAPEEEVDGDVDGDDHDVGEP